jgi:hypothetical protein
MFLSSLSLSPHPSYPYFFSNSFFVIYSDSRLRHLFLLHWFFPPTGIFLILVTLPFAHSRIRYLCSRWFKYDWDWLCVNKSQFVPVIFEPPCTMRVLLAPSRVSAQTNTITRTHRMIHDSTPQRHNLISDIIPNPKCHTNTYTILQSRIYPRVKWMSKKYEYAKENLHKKFSLLDLQ